MSESPTVTGGPGTEGAFNRARAERILDRRGLAALIATRPENVLYLTGFASVLYPHSGPTVSTAGVFIHGDAAATLVLATSARFTFAGDEDAEGLRRYYGADSPPHDNGEPNDDALAAGVRALANVPPVDVLEDPAAVVAALLRDQVEPRSDVGFDDPAFGAEVALRLDGRIRPRGAVETFREIRAVKLPHEVAALSEALRRNEAAQSEVRMAMREGMPAAELVTVFRLAFAQRGGRALYEVCGAGPWALANFPGSGRDIGRDEPVFFDAGGTVDRYWTDTGRTLLLGTPSRRAADVIQILAEGMDAVQAAARPGQRVVELMAAFKSVLGRRGLPTHDWFWGHGLGLEIYEVPRVRADSHDVLEDGMVFNFESPFREIGLGGVHLEDTFVVEATGARRLSTLPREILIAGS